MLEYSSLLTITKGNSALTSIRSNPFVALPLDQLLLQLSAEEARFFALLDTELHKTVVFYVEREAEMRIRWSALRDQLTELGDHMKLIQVCVFVFMPALVG